MNKSYVISRYAGRCCYEVSAYLDELKICIQNVNYAIIAKMTCVNKNDKHKEDLKQINMNLDNYF